MTAWTITADCQDPWAQAAFWSLALDYVVDPPPEGFTSSHEWAAQTGFPTEELEAGATVVDPAGALPEICFLKVPEGKVAETGSTSTSRSPVVATAGGTSETAIRAHVTTLVAAGATVVRERWDTPGLDHIVLQDPEGNEFCVV